MAPSGADVPVDQPERAAAPAGAPPEVRGLPVRCNEVGGVTPYDGQQFSTADQHSTRLIIFDYFILKFFTCDRLSLVRHGIVRFAGAAKCGHFSVPTPPPSHPTWQFPPPPSPKATALGILGTTTLVGHRRLAWRRRRCRRPPRSGGRRHFRRTEFVGGHAVCRRARRGGRSRGRRRAARAGRFARAVVALGSAAPSACTTRASIVGRAVRTRARGRARAHAPAGDDRVSSARGPRRRAVLGGARRSRQRRRRAAGPRSTPGRTRDRGSTSRHCASSTARHVGPEQAVVGAVAAVGAKAGAAAAARRRWARRVGPATEVPTLRAFGALPFDVARCITTRSRCCCLARHRRSRRRAPSPPRSHRLAFGRCRSD